MLRAILLPCLAAAALLGGALFRAFRSVPQASPLLQALQASGAGAAMLAGLLVLAAGLAGTLLVARARKAAAPRVVFRRARAGQALVVTPLALAAAAAAFLLPPGAAIVTPHAAYAACALGLALAFALLVAERALHGADASILPEAPALRRLAILAILPSAVAALALPGTALGLSYGGTVIRGVELLLAAAGIELAARATLQLYLPPPRREEARGAATSLVARLLALALRAEPAGRVIREQLGLDFSRSWALRYLRRASLPIALALAATAWSMSGLVLVPVDGRAVYERLGAPVRVLHPGLHAILPWPLGIARPLELGVLHQISLGDAPQLRQARAEDSFPVEADRLWDQPHPGELTLLVASVANTTDAAAHRHQLFQSVSADLRVVWRVGLADRDAIRATYAARDPALLLRAIASDVVTEDFAGRTLDAVLGADQRDLGHRLRARLQDALDRRGTGLEAVAVIVEAIHPPAGAADAYHAVRAAEITANASIFAERGRALTIRAQSRQYEFQQTASATAHAAEITGEAQSNAIRFAADQQAAASGRGAFLFERRMTAITEAVAQHPLTIIDDRLWNDANPTIDLRPMPGAPPTMGDGE